jgi:hypothetical protein
MKTLILPSLLMLASSISWGKAPPQNHKSLTSLMQEVRDPYFDSAKRKQYLQFTQTHMQKLLAKELGSTPADLSKKFIENPSHMDKLWEPNWIALQTEFYATLHQEVLFQRWSSRTKNKKVTDYGKNIAQALVLHLGKYSGVKEGRLYSRWNTLSTNKAGKVTNHRIPYFIFAPDTQGMLALDAHTPYAEILPKDKDETMGNPSLNTLISTSGKKSADDLQELAEIIQLNHRIYVRAVANSAKTVASVHYLTGEYTLPQTESKVESFIDSYCDGCSSKEKGEYKLAAMNYVKNTKNEFSQNYTAKTIVQTFCTDLKANGYTFPEKPDLTKKPIDIYERPTVAIDNTRVDRGNIHAQMALVRLSAIRKTVAEHDLGILFLTKALSNMGVREDVSATWLGCTPSTEASDILRVRSAVGEARAKVEEYITLINSKIASSAMSVKSATETLEYFTQTNVSATSEAVMTFPQGINLVIDSVLSLDGDVKRRKRVDTAVAWGGTIIGVGLTITGIGAPEGVAVLIAVAAMTKGAIWGSYYMYRSHQEKAFYKELNAAKKGVGTNFYLDGNLSKHYEEYRELRMNYITEFGQAAFQFAKIHQMALTHTGGNVTQAHAVIKTTFQKARAVSTDVGQDQMTQILVSVTF